MASTRSLSLEEHYEELEFLWQQRCAALGSADYDLRELAWLERRIGTHVLGLLEAADRLPSFLQARLAADRACVAFAAAYPLLRLGHTETARHVLSALFAEDGPAQEGLCQALCHATPA